MRAAMRHAVVCCSFAAALIAPQQRRTRARLHAESKYWSYDGVDVHYAIEQAPGANAVVVFGPGFGAGAFQFADVCRHVADGGVDAIAMDWLGQGRSWPEGDMAGRNFGVETWIAQLTAFVEQLDYAEIDHGKRPVIGVLTEPLRGGMYTPSNSRFKKDELVDTSEASYVPKAHVQFLE